jgi:hypothetical protein
VLGGAGPAQLGQDLGRLAHPLGQHRPDRVAGPHLHRLDLGQAAADQGGRDQAQVGADVVGPLQDRARLAAAGVDLGQGVKNGGGADPQPERPGDGADQVACLQRGRFLQEADQPGQLAGHRAFPLGLGDLVQAGEHRLHLQRRLPRVQGGQQPLGGQAQVAGLPGPGQDLGDRHPGGLGHRPGGQPLGHPQLHPGEVGGDLALAQQRDGRQQLVGGLADQPGEQPDQLQPAAGHLKVPVGLGHDLVAHGVNPTAW